LGRLAERALALLPKLSELAKSSSSPLAARLAELLESPGDVYVVEYPKGVVRREARAALSAVVLSFKGIPGRFLVLTALLGEVSDAVLARVLVHELAHAAGLGEEQAEELESCFHELSPQLVASKEAEELELSAAAKRLGRRMLEDEEEFKSKLKEGDFVWRGLVLSAKRLGRAERSPKP